MSEHARIALLANGSLDGWSSKDCECDPSTGNAPCRYCAIHFGVLRQDAQIDSLRALCKQLRDALDEHGTFLIEMAEDRPLADAAIKAYDDAMAAEGKEQ